MLPFCTMCVTSRVTHTLFLSYLLLFSFNKLKGKMFKRLKIPLVNRDAANLFRNQKILVIFLFCFVVVFFDL